jgi:hypothetical protein
VVWSIVEAQLSMIAASLPHCKRILLKLVPKSWRGFTRKHSVSGTTGPTLTDYTAKESWSGRTLPYHTEETDK